MNPLASSLHTIYRPLARSKRGKLPTLFSRPRTPNLEAVADREETPRIEEAVVSDEELQDDFESQHDTHDTQSTSHDDSQPASLKSSSSIQQSICEGHVKRQPSRSGSMGTVKIQRRSRLAEKLRDIFELQNIQEVVAGTLTHFPAPSCVNQQHLARDAMLAPTFDSYATHTFFSAAVSLIRR